MKELSYSPVSIKESIHKAGLRFFETKKVEGQFESTKIVVCVIAPALNEKDEISKLFESVRAQKTAYPVVVIVSDNGSTDGTPELAKGYGANVTFEENEGIGPARQKGLDLVRTIGSISQEKVVIIQTDSDSLLGNENYIQSVCQVYERDPYILASVGPTHFPIMTEGGPQKNIVNAKNFKACFGTLSLKELFIRCGRNIDDYLLSPPYRLLTGANSTYRLSVFDDFGISYPKDKSWESISLSIQLQQKIKSSQIAYIDDQIITTSNRAYADEDGITTTKALKEIKKQKYIKPAKSKDSISPVNTVRKLVAEIDRKTYSLTDGEFVSKVVSKYPKNTKDNQRIVQTLNASTGEVVLGKFTVIEHDEKRYAESANMTAKKDLGIFIKLENSLKSLGLHSILDSGYCVEAVVNKGIQRKHDDLDFMVITPPDFDLKAIENKILDELNTEDNNKWVSLETKKGWIWLKRGSEQINIHVLQGEIDGNNLVVNNNSESKYNIGIQKSEIILDGDRRYSVVHLDVNEILASKIRLIEAYGNKPRPKDIYDIQRLIKVAGFSKTKCIGILSQFYESKTGLNKSFAFKKALANYNLAMS